MTRYRYPLDLEFPDDESPNVILDKFIEALELAAQGITTEDLPKLIIPEDEGVTLTVQAEDKDDLPMILEQVQKRISEDYTSGYEPTWDIKGGE